MNRKVLFSVLIIGIVACLAGSTTWAAFTDTEKSDANTFTAGTLDLKVNGEDSVPQTIEDVYPGYTKTTTMTVTNAGNIAGDLKLSMNGITDIDGAESTDPDIADGTTTGALSSALNVKVDDGAGHTYNGPMSGINKFGLGTLEGTTGSRTLSITYEVPLSAGNEIQGDKLTYNIELNLEQSTTETPA